MRPPERGDVENFLRAQGYSPLGIERIAHGEWSQAFAFVSGDSEFVVRFSALDGDFRKDAFASRFASARLPVPQLLASGEDGAGRFYAIAPRATGAFLDTLDETALRRVLPSVFGAIDAMRQADLSGTRGFGVWDATGNAPHATWRDALLGIGGPRLVDWRARLEASPTGAEPFDRARARLADLASTLPDRRHLMHADLLNYNVLVAHDEVSAVLDWGSAMYGDWLFEVAWFVFWQPWFPAWSGVDFAAEAKRYFATADLTDFDARMTCCLIAIGLDNQAYCAFRGDEERMHQLAVVADRTLHFAR